MTIGDYLRILRAERRFVIASVVVCVAAAAALAWLGTQRYAATSHFFVSLRGPSADEVGTTFSGELYTQQAARAFAQIIAGRGGALAAIDELGLDADPDELAGEIEAAVPLNTAVINVTVNDPSRERALAIGQALDERVPGLLRRLEKPPGAPSPLDVSVSSPAEVTDGAVSPRKPVYLGFGLVIGLALGIAGAVLKRALDRRIRTDLDATLTVKAPVLARIPQHRGRTRPAVVLSEPMSAAAESYRELRAHLRAIREEHELRSMLVTSAKHGEGKTDLVANLGLTMAEVGERVLVMDANLRSPRLTERLGVRSRVGLSDVLESRASVEDAVRRHPVLPLEVLAGGSPARNPGELVDSGAFEGVLDAMTEWFDFVIVDSPALLAVADPAMIARSTSAVVLVARAAATSADDLEAARTALGTVGRRPLGIVLNRVKRPDSGAPMDGRAGPLELAASRPSSENGARGRRQRR